MRRMILAIGILGLAVMFRPAGALGDDTLTLHSADEEYQLVVPKGWKAKDFHLNSVQIGAINSDRGEYAEVVAERQEDYASSLQQYAEAKRDTMAMSLDNPRLSPPVALKVNGADAYRYELHGQFPGSKLTVGYSLTIFKSKTHFIQVIGWTQDSHFSDYRQELNALAEGFSETGGK